MRPPSGGPPTQAVRDNAADIAIATEGTVILGAPVGTDEYINTTVADRVDHDLFERFDAAAPAAVRRPCGARTPTRVKALYLCRDNIARFLEDHAETARPPSCGSSGQRTSCP